jgi:hypothetical protein
MKKGINLTVGGRKVDKVFRKAFVVSVALFFAVVVVSLGLIIYRLILKNSFDSLQTKEQQFNQQLLGYVEKRDKFVETKSRLSEIKKIISQRSPTTIRIDTLTDVVPTDSSVTALGGDEEQMQISLESENLASLNQIIEEKLIEVSQDKQKGIKKVDMKSFGLNPRSLMYTVTFNVIFN